MKLLLVLSLGCLFLHQAAAQCTRVVILMDALPVPYTAPTSVCPAACWYYKFADMYLTINTLNLTKNDALVFVPTSSSLPENTVTMTANFAYMTNLAANTNLYILTSNLEVGTPGNLPSAILANLNNNQMIKNFGSSVPTVHIVDYYAYLAATPAPAAAAANPCSFLQTSPPTLAGNCAYPISTRVVILHDTNPPYANLATNCLGSCQFYNTGMYLTLSVLGLTKNDALVIIPTASSTITTVNVIAFKEYLTNLSLNTNVYVFTSTPTAANIGSNILINAIPNTFPNVKVKDYGAYANPCPPNLPPGSCACTYIATNFGGTG